VTVNDSHTGAVGVALLAEAAREHCGVSTLVSLGDEIDISCAELLAYWLDDPATQAVAVSGEALGGPGRLAAPLRALARRKPVLAITAGPAYAAGEDLLARAGVLRTSSIGETLDTARILVGQPLPADNRIAITGNAGGLTAMAGDTARAHGFHVLPPSRSLRAPAGRSGDRIGLGIDALPAHIAEAAATAARSGAGSLLVILVGTRANTLAATASALAPVLDDHPRLPIAVVVADGTGERTELGRRGVPVFREPEQAVRALAHAREYAAWLRNGPHVDVRPDVAAPEGIGRRDSAMRHPAQALVRSPLAAR
jgi:acyl-CoA synthetase (NDP forming)